MTILARRGILVAVVAISGLSIPVWKSKAQSDVNRERKEYADKVRETYNFRFGKDHPSMPGSAAVEGNDFIQPGAFPKATYCAHCHEQAYNDWRQALHSNSFRTPFYRTSVMFSCPRTIPWHTSRFLLITLFT